MELGISLETLMEKLVVVAQHLAVPVISVFHVGAVGLGASGDVYLGILTSTGNPAGPRPPKTSGPELIWRGIPIILARLQILGHTLLGYMHVGVYGFVALLATSSEKRARAVFCKDLANNATKLYTPTCI